MRRLTAKGRAAARNANWDRLYDVASGLHELGDHLPDVTFSPPELSDGAAAACTDASLTSELESITLRMAQLSALKSRLSRVTSDGDGPLGTFMWTYERPDFAGYGGDQGVVESLNSPLDGWPSLEDAASVILAGTSFERD